MSELKTIWLTDVRGDLIYLAKKQDEDETRYYIGVAHGTAESKDSQALEAYGGKINPRLRSDIIRFLEDRQC